MIIYVLQFNSLSKIFYILMLFVIFEKDVSGIYVYVFIIWITVLLCAYLGLDKPLITPFKTIVFVGDTVKFTCTVYGENILFSWETKPVTGLNLSTKGFYNSKSRNSTNRLLLEVDSINYNGLIVRCHVFLHGLFNVSENAIIYVQG